MNFCAMFHVVCDPSFALDHIREGAFHFAEIPDTGTLAYRKSDFRLSVAQEFVIHAMKFRIADIRPPPSIPCRLSSDR